MGAKRQAARFGRNGEPPVAIGYYRISGAEGQKDGLSIDSQRNTVREYIAGLGWSLDSEYVDVMTGKRADRPGYQDALARARELRAQGRDVAIVVKWLNRFGRSLLERIRSRAELDELGCQLHGVNDGGYVAQVLDSMMAVLAQEESRQIGERVSEMRAYIVGQGWNTGKPATWGYLWRDPTAEERALGAPRRVLDENPDEAPYAREMWQRAAEGQTVRAIARWAQTLSVVARGGREMGWGSVACLLRSPIYVARPGSPRDVREGLDVLAQPIGHWPAIATDEQWANAQAAIAKHKSLPRQASGRFLLTGLVRCPECDGRMAGSSYRQKQVLRDGRRNGRYSVISRYVCQATQRGVGHPGNATQCRKTVHAASLEADVLRQVAEPIEALVSMDRRAEAALRAWWDRRQAAQAAPDRRADRERERLQAARSEAQAQLAGAVQLLVQGRIAQPDYDALAAVTRKRIESLDKELAAVQPTGNLREVKVELNDVLAQLGGLQKAIAGASCAAQRMTLSNLVVSVRPQADRRGSWRAEIEWSAMGRLMNAAAGSILGR